MTRLCKEKRRLERTEVEVEFERFNNSTNSRARRSETEKEEEDAKSGMKLMPILLFKSRQKTKGHREEYLWWKFWKKGEERKKVIRTKVPKFGAKFDVWDSGLQNPYKIDEEKEEKWNGVSLCEKKNEKNKLRRNLVKELLNQPIEMPELEKSEDEKLREQNLAEQNAEFKKYVMEHNLNNSQL